jgi:hypothetical protein
MEAEGDDHPLKTLSLALLLAPLALAAGAPRLASNLRPGMQLVYASEGRDQPPWVVELVEAGAPLKEGADCARVKIRRQANEAAVPEERLCIEHDMLYVWNAKEGSWLAQRPVGPHMELTIPRANGDSVRYVTGDVEEHAIGQHRLRVVGTVVTTTNAAGQPKRRLTEGYAVGLGTAIGGRFEVPDPQTPGAWRTEQLFELREIR